MSVNLNGQRSTSTRYKTALWTERAAQEWCSRCSPRHLRSFAPELMGGSAILTGRPVEAQGYSHRKRPVVTFIGF